MFVEKALLWACIWVCLLGGRVSSDPENLDNLEMTANLKMDPKNQRKSGNLKETVKVGEFFKISNFIPCILHFYSFQLIRNARLLARLQLNTDPWSGMVREKSMNFLGQGGWTPWGGTLDFEVSRHLSEESDLTQQLYIGGGLKYTFSERSLNFLAENVNFM